MAEVSLKNVSGTVAALAIIFTGFISVETRYAKASDLEDLLRSNEQKIVWDLEENVDTSESIPDKWKWYERLREKVDKFCDDYPDEDECKGNYLEKIRKKIEELE